MDFSPLVLCGTDRAAGSPSPSALSRPWSISSLPRLKVMEKEWEKERKTGVWERGGKRKGKNSVYGSGCLWNNFPYQCNCMSPVGKGIWFSPYSANGKIRTGIKTSSLERTEKMPGERETERHLLVFTLEIPYRDSRNPVVSRSFLIGKCTKMSSSHPSRTLLVCLVAHWHPLGFGLWSYRSIHKAQELVSVLIPRGFSALGPLGRDESLVLDSSLSLVNTGAPSDIR